MMTTHQADHGSDVPLQHGHISLGRPFAWLAMGWDDLWHHKAASLAYGAIVVGMGLAIIVMARHPYILAASVCGFMLVGPLMTTGLCELSRLREQGKPASFDDSLEALSRNQVALRQFALILLGTSLLWFGLSWVLLHQMLGSVAPGFAETQWGDLLSSLTQAQIIGYLAAAGVLAAVVFSISVISIPILIDTDSTVLEAITTSLVVTLTHLPSMLVWAALIGGLTLIGFVPALLGLLVIFPLLGHATWHAYRDLAPQED